MLDVASVRKTFQTKPVLDDVSFKIFDGENVGLVGPNGAGKSTLFKIIIDEMSPDKGQVSIKKGIRTGLLKQQFNAEDETYTVLDYTKRAIPRLDEINDEIHKLEAQLAESSSESILKRLGDLQMEFEALGGYKLESNAETALSGLGFEPSQLNRKMGEFSGGWRMRAELARVLISDPDLLLLDEPTNYLDTPAVEWLKKFLGAYKGTLVLISHDRYLLNELTDVTIELFAGKATRYPVNYDTYVKARDEKNKHLLAAKKNQDLKKDKLEKTINRFKAKASKASMAKSKMKQLEKMEDIDAPTAEIKGAVIRLADPPKCGPMLVELEEISKSYDGENWIYKGISLEVRNGEKYAIVGSNGMGKTTLMRIIAGQLGIEAGKRIEGHNVKVGYHSQDFMETFDPEYTVLAATRKKAPALTEQECRNMLGGFGFRGEAIEKKVGVLSGGEKVRLSLAALLMNPPNLLLLDEPTTHLDIQSREALQAALTEFKGTVLTVSHDITFLSNVADYIFEVSPSGLRKFYGNYEYYRDKIKEEEMAAAEAAPVVEETDSVSRKDQRRLDADKRKQISTRKKPLERKLAKIELLLEKTETRIAEIMEAFLTADNSQMKDLNIEHSDLHKKKDALEEEWEEVSLELEELLEGS